MTKKQERWLMAWKKSEGKTRLETCYKSCSAEKIRAFELIRRRAAEEGGEGMLRVLSYNSQAFTTGYIRGDRRTMVIDTAYNTYTFAID